MYKINISQWLYGERKTICNISVADDEYLDKMRYFAEKVESRDSIVIIGEYEIHATSITCGPISIEAYKLS